MMAEKISAINIVIAKIWGGGEQYVYDTTNALNQYGNDVYVAVDKNNEMLQKKYSEITKVVKCNLYDISGLLSLYKLKEYILANKINFIICHSGHAMLLCMLLKFMTGKKLIMVKHNVIPAKKDFYHCWQRKHTDAFICVSKLVYDMQTRELNENNKSKYHLIYNGIDTKKFACANVIEKHRSNFIIGYAGRIAKDKGIDILLIAFAVLVKKYPDIKLKIAGIDEKGYLAEIQNMITKYNLQKSVEYLGYVDDMVYFYHSLDVFVLPSVVREAFGLVICEAMYCGVPVITTNSGAQEEIIDNNINGYIVDSGNVEQLTNIIEQIYLNPIETKQIALHGKQKVINKFTLEQYYRSINNLFNNL